MKRSQDRKYESNTIYRKYAFNFRKYGKKIASMLCQYNRKYESNPICRKYDLNFRKCDVKSQVCDVSKIASKSVILYVASMT